MRLCPLSLFLTTLRLFSYPDPLSVLCEARKEWVFWAVSHIAGEARYVLCSLLFPMREIIGQKVFLGTELLWGKNDTGKVKLLLFSSVHLFLDIIGFSRVLGPLHCTSRLPLIYSFGGCPNKCFCVKNKCWKLFLQFALHSFSDVIFCAGFSPLQGSMEMGVFKSQLPSKIDNSNNVENGWFHSWNTKKIYF